MWFLILNYSTFHDDKQYEFDVQLCHRVGPNNYISKSLGSEVLVTLFKEGVGVNWPRLTGSKVKVSVRWAYSASSKVKLFKGVECQLSQPHW